MGSDELSDAGADVGERLEHAFASDVHTSVNLVAIPPFEVVIDVRELGFVQTCSEVENCVVRDVGADLMDAHVVLWAESGEHTAIHPTIALTGEKTNFGVEVWRDFGIPQAEADTLRAVLGTERIRM